jgi:drug/metabolite transporter (DMT)-like permease
VYHFNTAHIHILTGAAIISFSGIWVTWAGMEPTVSAFYRVFFGSFFLLLICLRRRQIRKINLTSSAVSIFCGLCFAADLFCWHTSIRYLGPGLATLLASFQVFVLTLVSIVFFHEKIRARFIVSIPLAFLGLALVVGFDWMSLSADYKIGIIFGLAAAFLYSAFLLTLRKIQVLEAETSFFYALLLVSLLSTLFLGFQVQVTNNSFAIHSLFSLASLLALALFSQTIGWALISSSLPKIVPSIAGLILLLQPALSFVWDVIIFSRTTSMMNWMGVALVLAAIYMGMSTPSHVKEATNGETKG